MSRKARKPKKRSAKRNPAKKAPSRPRRQAASGSEARLHQGLKFHQAGDLEQAERNYREVLQRDRGNPDALHLLGLIELQHGHHGKAVELLSKAIRANPTAAEFHSDLGMALVETDRWDAAAAAYARALKLDPQCVAALFNQAVLLTLQGNSEQAVAGLTKTVRLDPAHFQAHNNLGSLLQELGRLEEAATSFRQALQLCPNSPIVLRNLAGCLHEAGDVAAAEQYYRQALAIDPDPGTQVKLATCAGPVEMSVQDIARRRASIRAALTELSNSRIILQDPYLQVGKAPFYLAYHGQDERELLSELADFYLQAAPMLGFVAPHCRSPRNVPNQPIQIGFVSRYLHDHPVGRHFGGLLRNLPDDFSVTWLRFSETDDEVARRLAERADRVLTLPDDLRRCQQLISDLNLDILVYTDVGMDPLTYFLAFARLARVQCVLPGHPVTTGIPNMDAFLSCECMEVPDADDHYTEQLVRLQHIPNYFEKPTVAASDQGLDAFGLDAGHHNYLCVQMLFKIHPEFDPILQSILQRDPLGRIILFGDTSQFLTQRLMSRFQRSIPDVVERIRILPRLPLQDFLHLMTLVPAVLDTIHFSGGTTTSYALGVGAPVVTLPGEFFRGRTTCGMIERIGVTECVARTPEEYVEIALRLGTDEAWHASLRSRILAHNDAIFAQPGAVAEFAGFLREAAGKRC